MQTPRSEVSSTSKAFRTQQNNIGRLLYVLEFKKYIGVSKWKLNVTSASHAVLAGLALHL